MSDYWIWWIVAAVLVGAELLTGTFYLLAIGVGVALGGVAAWLGARPPVQFAVAGVLGVVGTIVAHRWRMAARQHAAAAARTRHRPGGAGAELERRRHGARRLSRHAMGRRARDARRRRAPRRMYIVATRAARVLASLSDTRGAARQPDTMPRTGALAMWIGSSIFTLALFVVALIVIIKAIRVVPQQHALVVERLGRFYAVLAARAQLRHPVRRPRRLPARPARNPARRARARSASPRTTRSCRSTASCTSR